ncbi:hypothetical protein OOT33_17565 [Sphingobium sp. DEHP117]|jgi:hypothetical protein|uniref:hypothetical protein n=1 Tax=Sphingobium sp. DEHP117 TaxID=2993436 RepID=UPI0027D6B67D|nr:hypothetical protein [Sphingobium sp. DEHP117]MDQ4422218.1 hypothetical protein [Sphingobium sp. DEHP117]
MSFAPELRSASLLTALTAIGMFESRSDRLVAVTTMSAMFCSDVAASAGSAGVVTCAMAGRAITAETLASMMLVNRILFLP